MIAIGRRAMLLGRVVPSRWRRPSAAFVLLISIGQSSLQVSKNIAFARDQIKCLGTGIDSDGINAGIPPRTG